METQFPLRPQLNALLNAQANGLPVGTELRGYETRQPDLVILYATQPMLRAGMEGKAAVTISREAIEDRGVTAPAAEALKILRDLAMKHALPLAQVGEPAPLVAAVTAVGTELHSPPVRFTPPY
ncbi:hypothetical protein MF271_19135 (plasmid) [Deinococcus sp. KNUC1210]|uniref:hypothetical protein n=1 Tax=Deinococcus sp. KNUC1210 TaxID=2917691 RepID=UPI001EF0E09F|nr:hypothetical protein [Deinococcus sp. KNUC1210]ULH17436.1 hypothetical protein MF271_19135 [Deinococcus sp. KNUC1210]